MKLTADHPHGMGESLPRVEDRALLSGAGRFIDDISLPRQAHAFFLRSPHAHADIVGVETSEARSTPGVIAVFTGEDIETAKIGRMDRPCPLKSRDGEPIFVPSWPAMATKRVRYVGETVAMVVAETEAQARTAAELIEIDYRERPCVTDVKEATQDDAPRVWESLPRNVALDWERGDAEVTDRLFEEAAHVTRLELVHNRLIVAAMEPRGAIAEFEPGGGRYTLYTPTQGGTQIQSALTQALGADADHIRVITPDVGGAFGIKATAYAEQIMVCWAAKVLGRPIKWYGDRSDGFLTDYHARDHRMQGELALDGDGRFLAIRCRVISNMGAYLTAPAPIIPTEGGTRLLTNVYRIEHLHAETRCVYTHTAPIGAYRGAGKPEYCHLVERLVDQASRELSLDPAELRRRNLVPPDAFPYRTPTGLEYDSGDFEANMDASLALMNRGDFAHRRARAAEDGKLLGFGFSVYTEPDGYKDNRVTMRFEDDGSLRVTTTAQTGGQGYETVFGQVAATLLGVPLADVRLVQGDTDRVGAGSGTGGSRAATVTATGMYRCAEALVEQAKPIAARLLEVAAVDLEFAAGAFTVAGTDRSLTLQAAARGAAAEGAALAGECHYDAPAYCYPNGCHACEVSIDVETGELSLERYGLVSDFGRVINPLLLEGQLHGGIAQGVGQVLLEQALYEPDTGQLLTGSFVDYCIPRAADLPSIEWGRSETACLSNPLGIKGCGESGPTAALPALMNAVVDALDGYDARGLDMPVTSEKLWRILHPHAG